MIGPPFYPQVPQVVVYLRDPERPRGDWACPGCGLHGRISAEADSRMFATFGSMQRCPACGLLISIVVDGFIRNPTEERPALQCGLNSLVRNLNRRMFAVEDAAAEAGEGENAAAEAEEGEEAAVEAEEGEEGEEHPTTMKILAWVTATAAALLVGSAAILSPTLASACLAAFIAGQCACLASFVVGQWLAGRQP